MSTIHTMFTGKTDSLIDAVVWNGGSNEKQWIEERAERNEMEKKIKASFESMGREWQEQHPELYDPTNIHHPDYMRMVVHQMD